MKQEWYVTFKVKHSNATESGKHYDYYAVKCDYEAQTGAVTNILSKYRCAQYPRVIHGDINTALLKKRNVISFNSFIIMNSEFKDA